MTEPKMLTKEELEKLLELHRFQSSAHSRDVCRLLSHIAALEAELQRWKDAYRERKPQ